MNMKDNIVRFWLTHHYLRKIGKRYPDFFEELIADVTDSYSQRQVMKHRYVLGKKFESVALDMNKYVSYIFRLHKQVIDKLVRL